MDKLGLNNISLTVWILIIAVILLFTPSECKSLLSPGDKNKEDFYTYYGYYKKYCPSCGWRSRYSCNKCTNCGWCVTASGYGECVPGDSSGPYFREDCQHWEYGDPYHNYPYSHVFPVVQTKDIYPHTRWNLRKGRWGYKKRNLRRKLRDQSKEMRELRSRLKDSQQ